MCEIRIIDFDWELAGLSKMVVCSLLERVGESLWDNRSAVWILTFTSQLMYLSYFTLIITIDLPHASTECPLHSQQLVRHRFPHYP